jgi:flagellar hook assembly protein FlgD
MSVTYCSSYDYKELYSYDNSGLLTETIFQDWSSNNWINDSRTTNIYESVAINEVEIVTTDYRISNHPNPFNPSTTIEFSIQNDSKIDISVFNIKGQKIKTLIQNEFPKGSHSIYWNGDNESGKPVSSGIYYYKLNVNGKTEAVKKCLLLK